MSASLIIHVYVICWNEEIIMPHFLSHYSYADRLFIIDNGSSDHGLEIAKNDPRVFIESFDTNNKLDDRAHVEIKNNVWKKSRGIADYVIVCDMDEFLYHPNISQALVEMKSAGATILKPNGYNMIGDRVPSINEDIKQVVDCGYRIYAFDKCVLFDPNKINEIKFGFGAHVCTPEGDVVFYRRPEWLLLHYKNLSPEYIIQRNIKLKNRLSEFNEGHGYGHQYLETSKSTYASFKRWYSQCVSVFNERNIKPVLSNEDSHDLYRKALVFMQQGKYIQAREYLDEILLFSPGDAEALSNLGMVLGKLDFIEDAQFCMQQSLALYYDSYQTWYNLGNLFYRTERIDVARMCYKEVIALNKNFKPAALQYQKCTNV